MDAERRFDLRNNGATHARDRTGDGGELFGDRILETVDQLNTSVLHLRNACGYESPDAGVDTPHDSHDEPRTRLSHSFGVVLDRVGKSIDELDDCLGCCIGDSRHLIAETGDERYDTVCSLRPDLWDLLTQTIQEGYEDIRTPLDQLRHVIDESL